MNKVEKLEKEIQELQEENKQQEDIINYLFQELKRTIEKES